MYLAEHLLSGDTLIDSNNGYGSLEIVGLSQNDQALRVKTVDGKLRFQLTDAHDRMEVTEPVGVLTAVPNYSAWLLGELPRIALYKKLSPEIKIALHGDARHFHFQSLALFESKNTKSSWSTNNRALSEGHFITPPRHSCIRICHSRALACSERIFYRHIKARVRRGNRYIYRDRSWG